VRVSGVFPLAMAKSWARQGPGSGGGKVLAATVVRAGGEREEEEEVTPPRPYL